MGVYLVEDEVGFDTDLVGFPSLGGCMALVLQVDGGLFGFHIPPGHKERAGAFAQFCRAHPSYGVMKHLYGSCYWANRYQGLDNPFLQWLDEMRYLAGQLGYSGPMSGFNTSATQTNIDFSAATYLEYRRKPNTHTCTIHYLNMNRIRLTKEVVVDTDVRRLGTNGQQTVPYLSKVVTDAQANGGQMSDVTNQFGFYSVA